MADGMGIFGGKRKAGRKAAGLTNAGLRNFARVALSVLAVGALATLARQVLVSPTAIPSSLFGGALVMTLALTALAYVAGREAGHQEGRESALQRSQPDEMVVDGARSLLIRTDHRGRIVDVNAALAEVIGQDEAALVGLDVSQFAADLKAGRLSPNGTGAGLDGGVWRLLRQRLADWQARRPSDGGGLSGDLSLDTADGLRWYHWSDVPLHENHRCVGHLIRGVDITERKRIEEALTEARDQAEAASAAKSRFLAMVSHEIRTPLNGILGMSDLLMRTQLSSEQKTYARAIETSGEALLSLIEDLLDFAKIEAGRLDLQPAPVGLEATVEQLVELMAPRAQAKGIELAGYVDPRLPPSLLTDPVRLKQVLFNLAGNGIKFTAEGGVAIEVMLGGGDVPDGHVPVLFQVRDTGIGISAADQDRIFGEFEQADPGPARAYGGTGLGLAISRRLVRLMGGDIELQSAPGAGACFSFTVPLAIEGVAAAEPVSMPIGEEKAPQSLPLPEEGGARAALALLEASFARKPDRAAPSAASAPLPAQRPLAGRRVLVISHALIEGPLVLRRLFDAGADVTLATQKDMEQELSAGYRPDALLVDAATGDAIALVERIRAFSNVPVGILIDPRERGRLGELQAVGYGAYLVKPVRTASLIAVVQSLLGDRQFAAAIDLPLSPQEDPTPHSLNILLCDDNEINLLLGRALLEKLGHKVTLATDGRRAVTLVAACLGNGEPRYDVILMDLHMPEVDGMTAARQIRELLVQHPDARPHMVALTADALPETRARCDAGLFDDWLAKPLQAGDLARSLTQSAVHPSVDAG